MDVQQSLAQCFAAVEDSSQGLHSAIFLQRHHKSMDKFIVRRPRSPQDRRKIKQKDSKLKQSTIKSLARVVVVEDILHLKSSLEASKHDEDKQCEILEKLKSMSPSTQVLKDTKIGKSVNKLRKSEYVTVKSLARLIVKKWKNLVEDENAQKESIEVRCDARTELSRCKARKLIADALLVSLPDPWTETLEKRLFRKCQRRVNNVYKRSVRSIVFLIKGDRTLQKNIKQGIESPDEILSRSLETSQTKKGNT